MKKLVNYCSIIFLLLVATSQVKAQSVDVVIRENGTERKESIDLPKSMTYPLDSLLNDWKAKNYIDLGKDCSTAEINPLFSDSVYIDRLSRIPPSWKCLIMILSANSSICMQDACAIRFLSC